MLWGFLSDLRGRAWWLNLLVRLSASVPIVTVLGPKSKEFHFHNTRTHTISRHLSLSESRTSAPQWSDCSSPPQSTPNPHIGLTA